VRTVCPAKTNDDGTKTVATNRKARHDYVVFDELEVGIALQGAEVKSLRNGQANLTDSYARVERGELWLHGMHVAPYESAARWESIPPRRPRKLLAHRAETRRLEQRVKERGYTLVPLRVYFRDGKAKISLGVCKGRKTYDKRDVLKERDEQRDLERSLRERE
jgi:SsrA-binding protein